MKKDNMDRT